MEKKDCYIIWQRQEQNPENVELHRLWVSVQVFLPKISFWPINYPPIADYKCFSSAHGPSPRSIMLGYKTNLNEFKSIEITQSTFSNHNEIKLEINKRRKFG